MCGQSAGVRRNNSVGGGTLLGHLTGHGGGRLTGHLIGHLTGHGGGMLIGHRGGTSRQQDTSTVTMYVIVCGTNPARGGTLTGHLIGRCVGTLTGHKYTNRTFIEHCG